MRTCAEYQELISAMLDGELTAEETAEVEAHIASCPECAAMYEAFAAVSGMEAAEVPDTLHEAVMTKVTAAQKAFKTQNNLVRLRPILTTAACLVVIVGTLFAVRTGFSRRGASTEAPMAAPAAGAADMAAPEMFMKAASESPMEAAPAEPAAPAMFAAAPMAPDTEEAEEGYSYANDIAGEVPLPAPEPKAKAENSAMFYLTLKIVSVTDYGFTAIDPDTDNPVEAYCDDSTEIADELFGLMSEELGSLMPDMIVTVGYTESEDSIPMVIYAKWIGLSE